MSSILKALKKLEEQKAPRPKYEVDISSGIMRERRPGRERRWAIPAAMVAIAFAAAMTTYGVMSLKTNIKETQQPIRISTEQGPPLAGQTATAVVSPPAAPPSAPTQVSPQQPPPVASGAPAAGNGSPPVSRPQKQARPADAPRQPVTAIRAPVPVSASAPLPSPSPVERQDSAVPRVPDLKLTGIAWEKDSASRYAVVNGVAVRQGSTVGGAKIEEILPDKVRFSQGPHSFEVSLGTLPAPH